MHRAHLLGYSLAVSVGVGALALGFLDGQWVAGAIALGVALALALGTFVESGPDSAKEVALIATMTGIAVAGRLLVHPFPGVQPMTVIVIASGAAFGLRIGVSVGALGALVSNFFFIQGPWTPWQMTLWALCGAAGALLPALARRRLAFAFLCAALSYAFSSAMDVSDWWYRYAHTWAGLTVSITTGFPFTLAHALGSFVIAFAVGPELVRMLERFARRLRAEIVWDDRIPPPPKTAATVTQYVHRPPSAGRR
jgi:energy-coupling factor transport system substrate-specific component